MTVRAASGRHRSCARRFEPILPVALREPQDPKTRAVALLGVWALDEDRVRQFRRRRTDGRGPAHDACRRPLHVLLVALGHVLRLRRVTTTLVAPGMAGDPIPRAEDLHRGAR